MKNIKRIMFISICCVTLLTTFTACSSQPAEEVAEEITTEVTTETESESESETEPETEEPTIFADTLNEEEHVMYDMLVSYSSTLLSPSSLRVSNWIKGTVNTDYFDNKTIKVNNGDTLEYVLVTAQNKMGGNTSAFVYVHNGSLYTVEGDLVESALSMPSFYLSNTISYNEDTINKINIALKEHFESIGY